MGDGTPLGGGEKGGYEEMSFLTLFLFIAIPLWVAGQWSKRSLDRAYEDCFYSRPDTDGLWCSRPISYKLCKGCPHYHFHN